MADFAVKISIGICGTCIRLFLDEYGSDLRWQIFVSLTKDGKEKTTAICNIAVVFSGKLSATGYRRERAFSNATKRSVFVVWNNKCFALFFSNDIGVLDSIPGKIPR
jgi:hypothetical protein